MLCDLHTWQQACALHDTCKLPTCRTWPMCATYWTWLWRVSYNFVLEEILCDLHSGQHWCALHDTCKLPTCRMWPVCATYWTWWRLVSYNFSLEEMLCYLYAEPHACTLHDICICLRAEPDRCVLHTGHDGDAWATIWYWKKCYILDNTLAHCTTYVSCLYSEFDLCVLHNGHMVRPVYEKTCPDLWR